MITLQVHIIEIYHHRLSFCLHTDVSFGEDRQYSITRALLRIPGTLGVDLLVLGKRHTTPLSPQRPPLLTTTRASPGSLGIYLISMASSMPFNRDSQPAMAGATSGNKRKGSRSRSSYPRKRALIACETCRQRKTKCDNQRPTCGGCVEMQIQCQYKTSSLDVSTFVTHHNDWLLG